jgi:tetratricopeptide (TPR) repeat protein/transcriptional regulator with XRE-family HTH domain
MPTFAQQVKSERQRCSWSQEQFAELLGTTATNVSRWERGITVPKPYFRQKLCQLLGKTIEELGLLEAHAGETVPSHEHETLLTPQMPPLCWHLPHHRNPLFTGRDDLLDCLHCALNGGGPVALARMYALSGLGGIGKTQTTIEYAYRYADAYQAIFWVRAESRAALLSDMVALAETLHLIAEEEEPQKQHSAITAIRRWLQDHSGWLLILDNLEDLSLLREVLPGRISGHVVLTTRMQSVGLHIRRFDLEMMEPDEGALFLLRRAKRIGPRDTIENASQADREAARAISQHMDGLPLALDQAGAYIEETACSVAHYLILFQRHHGVMLGMRDLSDGINADHPLSVRATLALSLVQIRRANPLALDLLRLCAFLDPDAIPEELLMGNTDAVGSHLPQHGRSPLEIDVAIAELRRYSLLRRHPDTQTLSLHRLIQVVVKDTMDEATQRLWVFRAVQAVSRAFPRVERWVTSSLCQRYFAQAQTCAALIDAWDIQGLEAGRLLIRLTSYLFELGEVEFTLLPQAEPLLIKALAILPHDGDAGYPEVADAYLMLGRICNVRWDSSQAVRYFRQALAIYEQAPEPDLCSIRACLSSLGDIYLEVDGDCAQSELFYQRALAISERIRGPDHTDIAIDLRDLGVCYALQGNYAQAESLLLRALDICMQALGVEHALTCGVIHAMGKLYLDMRQDAQAESLLCQALEIRQRVLKPDHVHIALTLRWLGDLYLRQRRVAQATPLLLQALGICQRSLGMEHALTCTILHSLGRGYIEQRQIDRAKSLLQQTVMIRQRILGADHPDTIGVRADLETVEKTQRKAIS